MNRNDRNGSPVGERDEVNQMSYVDPATAVAGGPTGQSRGASPSSTALTLPSGFGVPTIPINFQCEVEGCDKAFKTKQGRGQHVRHAHPEAYNNSIVTSRKKARWYDEEKLRLAAQEASLELEWVVRMSRGEKVKGLNEKLQAAFPERTLDAIKSRRRNPEHRQMVEEATKRLESRASTVVTEVRQSPSEQDEWQSPQSLEDGPPDCDPTTVVTGRTLRPRRKVGNYALQAIEEEDSLCPEGPAEDPPDCVPMVATGRVLRPRRKKEPSSPKTQTKKGQRAGKITTNVTGSGLSTSAGEREDDGGDVDQSQQGPTPRSPRCSRVTEQASANPSSVMEHETKELTGASARDRSGTEHHGTVPDQDFQVAIQELAADLTLDVYGGEVLKSIAMRACAGEEVKEDLEDYLREYFVREGKEAPKRPSKSRASNKPKVGKRKQRRAEYARVQTLYQKSRHRCAQEILDGTQVNKVTDHQNFIGFWKRTMTETPPGPPLVVNPPTEIHNDLWKPVTREDIRQHLPPCSTATGPDGMTARELRSVPFSHLALLTNLILTIGEVPRILAVSRTTFIPKVPEATKPQDFRPIAVAPNLLRLLHKILAKRMQGCVKLDVRQRAFIPADGCGENVAILQALLSESRRTLSTLHMAQLDLRKAFDSVSVDAVLAAASSAGLPTKFLHYLEVLYQHSKTLVQSGDLREEIRAARGVKQGDPLSPLLFNLVVDGLLRELPAIIGFRLGETMINAMAFADDLTLVASTRGGLQELLNQSEAYFKERGLSFNPQKSSTLSLVPSKRQKKIKVEQQPFQIAGSDIPTLDCIASWKYLGVLFNTRGRKVPLTGELIPLLERLSAAPLKPQQRLVLLKHYLLPRFYHRGTFAHVTAKLLRRLDTCVRLRIRRWLRLPHDTPVGYFHAPVESGGLGIPALRHMLPRLKLQRMAMLRMSDVPACGDAVKCPALILEERKATTLLTVNGVVLRTAKDVQGHWAELLHNSVDGEHLRTCKEVPESQQWVSDGTRLLSGRDFVDCAKLRINAIPTLARTSRGRNQDISCRAGCRQTETLGHVLQQCERTHGARIKRHDGIVSYLCKKFREDKWTVEREPCIKTKEGNRFPDIVIRKGERTAIVDVQVVGTSTPLETAHRRKQSYYARNDEVVAYAKADRKGTPIVTSCTVSYRGVWSSSSRADLHGLGVTKSDTKVMSVRALQGSMAVFGVFRRSTSRAKRT